MARAQQPGRTVDDSPLIIAGTIGISLIVLVLGYPGLLLLPIGVTIAAFVASPPELTGKKNGRPVPEGQVEESKLAKYQARQSLKRLFIAYQTWWPGWPMRLSYFIMGGLAVGLLVLPAARDPFGVLAATGIGEWVWSAANSVGLFLTIVAYEHASRAFSSKTEPRPAVTVTDLSRITPPVMKWGRGLHPALRWPLQRVLIVAAAVVFGLLWWFLSDFFAEVLVAASQWLSSIVDVEMSFHGLPPVVFGAAFALSSLLGLLGASVRHWALKPWREREAARADWAPKWESLKFDPPPHLVSRTHTGTATVDIFRAPAGSSARTLIDKEDTITPELGEGLHSSVVESEQRDKSGTVIPGSVHPNEFKVVTIPSDSMPDMWDANVDDGFRLLAAGVEWKARFVAIKEKKPPRLIKQDVFGSAIVDTFEAPPGRGASEYAQALMGTKIAPALGAGVESVILDSPEIGPDGAPIPGSKHPTQFRIVRIKSDAKPNLADPSVDDEELEVILEATIAAACDSEGYARTSVSMIIPIHDEKSEVAAWYVGLQAAEDYARYVALQLGLHRKVSAALEQPAVINYRARARGGIALYVGGYSDERMIESEENAEALELVRQLEFENDWRSKWDRATGSKINAPLVVHGQGREDTLASGAKVKTQVFSVLHNELVSDYFKLEEQMSVSVGTRTLGISGCAERLDSGFQRSAQFFSVNWVEGAGSVPTSPMHLAPKRQSGLRATAAGGEEWLLKIMINRAFDAAKLSRPEVFATAAFSDPNSDKRHLWRVDLILTGGVTVEAVRKSFGKIKETLQSPWAAIFKDTKGRAQSGATLVIGAHPDEVTLVSESRDRPLLVDLEWQRAFVETNVASKSTGEVPKLIETHTLEHNDQVRSTTFTLPGIGIDSVRGAVKKLSSATGNAFLQVEADQSSAKQFIMLSSREDPMPQNAAYPFDQPSRGRLELFGVGIDGLPNGINWSKSAHLMVVGGSGSGKSIFVQSVVYGGFAAGHQVVVIDAQKQGADFAFAKKHTAAFCTNLEDALATMEALYALVKERIALNAKHEVGSIDDLPEDVRPPRILLFIDEFGGLILAGNKPSTKAENDPKAEEARLAAMNMWVAKTRIAFLAGRIGAEARSAGVHEILITQKLTAASLPDSVKDLKTNMGRIGLGKMSPGDKMSAFRDPDALPNLGEVVPPGRMIWESVSDRAVALQGFFSPTSEFRDHLHQILPNPDEIERIDYSSYLPEQSGLTLEGKEIEMDPSDVVDETFLLDLPLGQDPVEGADDVDDLPEWAQPFAASPEQATNPESDEQSETYDDAHVGTVIDTEVIEIPTEDSGADCDEVPQPDQGSDEIDWDGFFTAEFEPHHDDPAAETEVDGYDDSPGLPLAYVAEDSDPSPMPDAGAEPSTKDRLDSSDASALVFIDIDGCLAPTVHRRGLMAIEDEDSADGAMFVDPVVVDALIDIDAVPVWSTKRSLADADALSEATGLPNLLRAEVNAQGTGWEKSAGILAVIDAHPFVEKIIVIDDDDNAESMVDVLDDAGLVNLVVTPETEVGLTLAEIDRIKEFLAAHPESSAETEPPQSDTADPAPAPARSTSPKKVVMLPSDDDF